MEARNGEPVGSDSRAGERVPIHASTRAVIAASQMTAFKLALQTYTGRSFPDYRALHDFSVRDYRTFWRCFLDWLCRASDLSGDPDPICLGDDCEHAQFFPRLQLNYADILLGLSIADADAPALTACHADGRRLHWTRGQLRERVARLAQALSELGLEEGDRVVGVMRNDGAAVVASLAVTALGATLSTAAPEMGVEAILDRFAPLAPRLLLAHTAERPCDSGLAPARNIAELARALPSLQAIIRLDDGALSGVEQPVHAMDDLIAAGDASSFAWRRFPFNHPLFILFSSGTTGRPKCIVHGAGGSLLEHLKEHRLHTDLRPGDKMYFHTGCGWMMWNWQLSALASGVEIVTWDGPISTVDSLWRLAARERVTVFGTSPAYLGMCEEAGLAPGRDLDLSALRAVLSTGSVLHDRQYRWVRDQVKAVPLQSISGGTDILGCFVLGNPNLPVYIGEAQCKSLGLDVQAWKDARPAEGIGELVCTNPFPSRPLGFFGDAHGTAFHAAYFARNPGVWTHGDLIEFSPEGGARLHGRCDGVLNVRGIKVAPGEIYRVLKDVPGIREAMVVEQRSGREPDGRNAPHLDGRVVLLLVLQDGAALTAGLVALLRRELARRLSKAHVPDRILAVDELPVTHSGKFSEAAARSAVNGQASDNATALRNPGCLEAIRTHPALRLDADSPAAAGEAQPSLEHALQALWHERFGFEPIGLDDSFFELGGNSLLAARLLGDVRRLTGRALPLATLFVAPTIRRLAALIEEHARAPSPDEPAPMRAGQGTPLFLVHGLSGSVLECWALVRALRTTRPVYGLNARGVDGDQSPQRRVEDIASGYVEQIRQMQGRGPYAVAGYSFGGLVAFEMAQQLHQAGERCEVLCLLDTYVYQERSRAAWLAHRCARAVRKLGELGTPQLLGYVAGKLTLAADGAASRLVLVPSPATHRGPPPPQGPLMHESMGAALAAYKPRPYDGGPVTFIRARVGLGSYFDPLPLWRRLARAGFAVLRVPGGHLDMLGPSLQRVAAALDQALEGAVSTQNRNVPFCPK